MTDKPAATVHGTGSGEAKDWFESMPSLSDVPTPPASPMVTQAREKLEEAMRYSGDRWEEWGERALHVAELLDDALALLRAAEKK